ncbi:MAG TPA: transketolase [Anaerolineales bacterium]|jgi:transketolase|nr:transketolase [Anaerolineales bacterium]
MMQNSDLIDQLKARAFEYRETIIRLSNQQPFGIHLGGSLSLAEILTVLYFNIASVDPEHPGWADRDRIILSKGHGNIGLLVTLAQRGFFPLSVLEKFNQVGSMYSMHTDVKVAGIEHSTGSLGHGLSVAIGMALVGKREKKPWKVYCILGDGESMEGSVWEGLMSASHFGLSNLTAIIDRNRLSQEGTTQETMELDPLSAKGEAFGWTVLEIDGHRIEEVLQAFQADSHGKPKLIIANTIKGRGVPALENQPASHFSHLDDQQLKIALDVIQNEKNDLKSR